MKILLGSVLVCLLVRSARGQKGGVSFSGTNFTLTCPGEGTWYKDTSIMLKEGEKSYVFKHTYDDTSAGHYYCIYTNNNINWTYHFYVWGRVCEHCYELHSVPVAVGIVADVLLTLGVILVVYMLVRRRKAAKTTHKKGSSSGPSGGPSTRSEYEPLRPNPRSDVYSPVHRTG